MDSLDALANIVSQTWLANLIEPFVIWDCSSLMELSEQVIEINDGSGIMKESIPVAANLA